MVAASFVLTRVEGLPVKTVFQAVLFVALLCSVVVENGRAAEVVDEVALVGPFAHQGGAAWSLAAPLGWQADTVEEPGSLLILFENGAALGSAHALHDDIRRLGAGRFSHWGELLYFSSSDGTDPNTNGRVYTVSQRELPLGQDDYRVLPVRDPFTALPARSLALGVGGEAAYDGDRSSARAGASGAADA
ncbi:MAG: hypothetical protein ACI9EF_001552, partial [Pseudohongiellaceae bacterium]